ncbi:uncharacterized protein M421DRAFT_420727 [Didymella exigua CBS 183.55]|uniref:Uncharacterized protein n=1 Tax=Didymella exigua CBS 183.55 TaxID=1150837 RepID=A0A6A5RLQ7_9PLEO|nr:uncharacterized protein M421DRAFT_420727 [Didymella exigua CBS 183.55]KAF1928190.1 hypothetical protein M421DRAFT_420727 [Didymella exigua CBS 183.55]
MPRAYEVFTRSCCVDDGILQSATSPEGLAACNYGIETCWYATNVTMSNTQPSDAFVRDAPCHEDHRRSKTPTQFAGPPTATSQPGHPKRMIEKSSRAPHSPPSCLLWPAALVTS